MKMKKSTRFKIITIGLGMALMASYTNCSKVAVSNIDADTNQDANNLVDNNDGTFDFNGTVKVGAKQASELDVVWVIDNSASMAAEIAHVRNNLDRFTQTVSTQSNLKMALISKAGGGDRDFNLNYPDKTRFMQINQEISSYNALEQTSAAICVRNEGACAKFSNPAVQGRLKNFMRPNSKKVFVVVTDDESSITPAEFNSAFGSQYSNQTFTLFGFVGLGPAQSPCQDKTGSRYMELAQKTQGQVYNICDRDWTQTFSTLARSILTLVGPPPIILPHKTNEIVILSVTLDGQPLDQRHFSVTADGIVLAAEFLEAEQSYQIKVHYKLKDQPES